MFIAFGPITTRATKYTIPINEKLKIDPTKPNGNLSQYICHSCDPNLGIKDRTCFAAFRNIDKHEEIRIDYAMIVYEYGDEITKEERTCRCGNSICRGEMGYYKGLSQELKDKYDGYVSEWLIEKKSI